MESEKMELNASLVESLSMIEDPRIERTKDHDLFDILVLSVMAVICGAEGLRRLDVFARIGFDSSFASETAYHRMTLSAEYFGLSDQVHSKRLSLHGSNNLAISKVLIL